MPRPNVPRGRGERRPCHFPPRIRQHRGMRRSAHQRSFGTRARAEGTSRLHPRSHRRTVVDARSGRADENDFGRAPHFGPKGLSRMTSTRSPALAAISAGEASNRPVKSFLPSMTMTRSNGWSVSSVGSRKVRPFRYGSASSLRVAVPADPLSPRAGHGPRCSSPRSRAPDGSLLAGYSPWAIVVKSVYPSDVSSLEC